MEHMGDRKFIEVYVYPKNGITDKSFDKAIAKIKWCSFFASHGILIFATG